MLGTVVCFLACISLEQRSCDATDGDELETQNLQENTLIFPCSPTVIHLHFEHFFMNVAQTVGITVTLLHEKSCDKIALDGCENVT